MKIVFILAAIFIFGFLIAIHELGHFLAARLCGVRVNEFSIGMGPCIWHGNGRNPVFRSPPANWWFLCSGGTG
ncbi:MAG: site-2 protease family protein [Eisenbergiella sp.]